MDDEGRQMHGTGTPGPEANPPEPLRPPEARPPDELWGLWDGEQWASNKPFGSTATPYVCTKRSEEVRQTLSIIRGRSHVLALLGVSPAVREQRDKLAGLLRKVMAYCAERWVVGQHRTLDMDLLEEIEAALDEVGGATQEREGREADVS